MVARRHHFVSQCYLRGFAANRDKPRLFVVDGKEGKSFTTGPENVALERDFHTVDVAGMAPDVVETGLAAFEGEAAAALDHVIAARSIRNLEDRGYLISLMALFAARNPRRRESTRKFQESVMKRMMDMATATPERWESQVQRAAADGFVNPATADYARMRAFVEADEYRIDLVNERHLELELKSWQTLTDLLSHRKWMLFRTPPGLAGFVSSDHPICIMWSDPARRGVGHPPGYGLMKTQVLFPISRELAMIGAFEIDDMECDADELTIAQINASTILYSTRQIYARSDEFSYRFGHNTEIMRGRDLLGDQALRR